MSTAKEKSRHMAKGVRLTRHASLSLSVRSVSTRELGEFRNQVADVTILKM